MGPLEGVEGWMVGPAPSYVPAGPSLIPGPSPCFLWAQNLGPMGRECSEEPGQESQKLSEEDGLGSSLFPGPAAAEGRRTLPPLPPGPAWPSPDLGRRCTQGGCHPPPRPHQPSS